MGWSIAKIHIIGDLTLYILVGSLKHVYLSIQLGRWSSQLTKSYFSEGWIYHQPVTACELEAMAIEIVDLPNLNMVIFRSYINYTMWGPRSIAKLVQKAPITMVYGTQITIVTGANLNQLTSLGGHRFVYVYIYISLSLDDLQWPHSDVKRAKLTSSDVDSQRFQFTQI